MISTLTYSPYSNARTVPFNQRRTKSRPAKTPKQAEKKGVVPASNDEMMTMVERLNRRINPEGRNMRFQLEQNRRQPRIVMLGKGNKVLSQYHRDDMDQLEYNLHEMAGFQLSILT